MKQRVTLYAEEGYVLTDGEHYGRVIHLAEGADASAYYEITEEEYAARIAEEETEEPEEAGAVT